MALHARRGQRTTSLSTSDEGIVMDYGEEMPRKRRVSRPSPISNYRTNGHTADRHNRSDPRLGTFA